MPRSDRLSQKLAFDRVDFAATRALLILIAVFTLLAGVGVPLFAWLRGGPVRWTVSTFTEDAPPFELQPGAATRWSGDIEVRLSDASPSTWLAVLLPGLILSVAVGVVAWLLIRLLRGIQDGRPFASGARARLRGIAATIIVAPALITVARMLADLTVADEAFLDLPFALTIAWGPIIAVMAVGLIVAALGEAFGRGAALQSDVDGLV